MGNTTKFRSKLKFFITKPCINGKSRKAFKLGICIETDGTDAEQMVKAQGYVSPDSWLTVKEKS